MIDFTSQTYPLFAGYLGEHNATEIVIVKPVDLSGDMYSVAFMTNGEVIHSKYFSDDEEIRVALWQQLTQDNDLFVQLEAYDGNGAYLGKSSTVKLLLSNSVHGIDVIADTDNPDVYSEIAQNSWFRETLEDNVETLDKLSTSALGDLLFDGKPVGGGGGGGGISDELYQEIVANTEKRHWHDNKSVLDKFGISNNGSYPTFKANDLTAAKQLTFLEDVVNRDNTLHRAIPAKAVVEGSKVIFKNGVGTGTEIFSFELPESYTPEEIDEMISRIPKFAIEVVETLPTEDISDTTVYLLKDTETGGNLYTEYIYVNNAWECLGSQQVDLEGYAKAEDIPTKTSQLENDSGFITKADIPTDESYEFIGKTPLMLEKGGNIKLVADGETSYSMVSPTVWNFDNAEFTSQNISLSTDKGYYEFTVTGSPTAYHQSWIQFVISGLEIGKSYNLIFDTNGLVQSVNDKVWSGVVTVWSGTTTGTLIKSGVQLYRDGKFNFTATEENILIRYYPANSNYSSFAGWVGHFNKMYLNHADTSEELTEIYNNSGTFNDVATFKAIPENALITTDPTADVYRKAPTDITLTQGDTPADAKVTGEKIAEVKSYLPLYGKTIVNFGDSIFGNAQPPVDISTHLANKTGATVYNCGFGGCRMSQHISGWNAFSMYSLANAITSGNYTEQDEAIANTDVGLPERFAPSLERLKGIDFSKVDIVTIAYGTNDFTSNIDMDNEEDARDITTLAGALRYSIETLLTAYPNLKIFVLSTAYRAWIDGDNGNAFLYDSNTFANGDGVKLADYNKKLAEVADEYNLPFVDDYNIGINQFNRLHYFPVSDGTHHNEEGRRLIASHLAKELY